MSSQNPAASRLTFQAPKVNHGGVTFGGRWLFTRSQSTCKLWDLAASDPTESGVELPVGRGLTTFSPDGRWLVTTSPHQTPQLRNLTNVDSLRVPRELHGCRWTAFFVFTADGRLLISCDDEPRLWDLTAIDPIEQLTLFPVTAKRDGLAVSSDSRWMATLSHNGEMRLWDLESSAPATTSLVLANGEQHSNLAFSPNGTQLVTSGRGETTVRLWDISAKAVNTPSLTLRGHTRSVSIAEFSNDNRWLVTTGSDATVRLWDLHLDSLIHRAKRLAGRPLNGAEKQRFQLGDGTP